jgi:hypothetical protein
MTRAASADRESCRYLRNRLVVALLTASAVVSACTQNEPPPPAFSPSKPGLPACANHLTEAACEEGRRCRWVKEHKRADGTWATAHCAGR